MSDTRDDALDAVAASLLSVPDFESKVTEAIRAALDEVIDGARTGRYSIKQLEKTESTYIGTKVEILLRHALEFPRGKRLDNLIAGHEVDTKFSIKTSWMIPKEARDQLCMLVTADEHKSVMSLGLIRATDRVLTRGLNRDGKVSVSAEGRAQARWLLDQVPMRENFLLHLSPEVREAILSPESGKKRVEALFTRVTDRLIPREVVRQVIRLHGDPMKRAREAKANLSVLGYRVLCARYDDDRQQMLDAGFNPQSKDEWLSLRD